MTVINTNTAATVTSNALATNSRAMSQSMERLSTGQRINSASDDAAGLAISSKMTSQIRGLDQAVRNANDAISMVQTADGAAIEVSNMLQRMRELSVQAATGTNTSDDVTSLNAEFTALRDQIQFVANNTQWNGSNILNGTAGGTVGDTLSVSFQVGANNAQMVTLDFGDFNLADGAQAAAAGKSKGALGADLSALAVNTGTVITKLDTAIAGVNTQRSSYGAMINRLEYAVDNLANVSQNAAASRSRVLDADYATESTELARTQIIQQAGTAMLAQANQQSQSVLALLK
jgi:flagellin